MRAKCAPHRGGREAGAGAAAGINSATVWYLAALAETWRDQDHEDEARRAGVWLKDLRQVAT